MLNLKRRAKRQKVLRTLNTIVRRAHWIYGIAKIALTFEVSFKTINPKEMYDYHYLIMMRVKFCHLIAMLFRVLFCRVSQKSFTRLEASVSNL